MRFPGRRPLFLLDQHWGQPIWPMSSILCKMLLNGPCLDTVSPHPVWHPTCKNYTHTRLCIKRYNITWIKRMFDYFDVITLESLLCVSTNATSWKPERPFLAMHFQPLWSLVLALAQRLLSLCPQDTAFDREATLLHSPVHSPHTIFYCASLILIFSTQNP